MSEQQANDLTIVRYGHPALRQPAARVGRIGEEVRRLVAAMVRAMRAAGGLGLAANQVGVPRRVAVVEYEGKLISLVDPEIVSMKGSQLADEGCLSLPKLYGQVARPTQVVVRARDLSGRRVKIKAEGLLARALCHEVDHLEGRLFVDRVEEPSLYWLMGTNEEGHPLIQPTTLDDALKVFTAAHRPREA